MDKQILGLHHVTAIAGHPQPNLDFYAGLLGLRLVKKTVNFDDPSTYHLYYGDELGRPGSILTFFAWPDAPRGRQGNGQVTVTAFSLPQGSLGFWMERLKAHGVAFEQPVQQFDEEVISFQDPDGLQLELIAASPGELRPPWNEGPVPEQHAIRGIHGITAAEEGYERTASLLTDTLGFRLLRAEGNRFRYEVGEGGPGTLIDLLCLPAGRSGSAAAGTIHHVAWRTANDQEQKEWRRQLSRLQYNVSPVMDRQYFHSIYFREPGGVLFEIATDPPGFTVDEPAAQLGASLKLPSWLEPYRSQLDQVLPPLKDVNG